MAVDQLKLQVVLGMVDKASGVLKGLKKNTTDVAEKYREAKKQLHEMNDAQRLVADARALQTALTVTGSKTILLKTQIKQLQDQTHLTGEAADKQRKQLKKLQDQQEANTRVSDAQKQRAKSLREALDKLGVGNLAQAEGELAQKIKASTAALEAQKTQLDQVMQRERKLATLKAAHAKSMQKWGIHAGAGVAAAASGQAVASTGMVPVKAYAAAEDAAVGLKVAMMGVGGAVPPAYEKIKQLAEQLGNKLPGTTADFQNMMTMLVRQGMPAEKILGGMGQASAYLAVQLKKTPEAAAEFASKMQDATSTVDSDMMGLMDTIQRAYYLGVNETDMLQAFKNLGPVMDMVKMKGLAGANALAPFVVMMDQAGMAGEQSGNAIRKMIQRGMDVDKISKVTKDLKKVKGIDLSFDITDGKGEFGGMDKLMANLQKLGPMDSVTRLSVLKDIFGDDSETNQVLSKIIEKGLPEYEAIQAKLKAQADLQTRVNEQLGTLTNLWDAASGTFTNTMAVFGEAMAPEIKALTEWFGKASEKVGAFAKENPGLTKAIGLTVLGIGGLLVVGGTLLTVFSAFALKAALVRFALGRLGLGMASTATKAPLLYRMGHMLGRGWALAGQGAGLLAKGFTVVWPWLKVVGNGLLWMGRIMLTTPIGLIIAGVAALAYGLYWLGTNFAQVKAWAVDAFNSIWAAASASINKFLTLPQRVMAAFQNGGWSAIGGMIVDGLVAGLNIATGGLFAKVTSMVTSMAQAARTALGIQSPSRVFAEIGGHVMGGLDAGLAKGEADPLTRMKGAAAKLAGVGAGLTLGTAALAMSAQVQGPGSDAPGQGLPTLARSSQAHSPGAAPGSAGPTSSPISITIHAAPGMDPQAIARAVAAELDRRDRASRSRVRSAMQDIDG